MIRIKLSQNFNLDEFISKEIYNIFGIKSKQFIDPRLVTLAEELRDHFKTPILINNWATGGLYNESGLRDYYTTTGAKYSQHKRGLAIDCKMIGLTDYNFIREEVRKNFNKFKMFGLSTIELGTKSWLHCDLRWTEDFNKLYEVPYQ